MLIIALCCGLPAKRGFGAPAENPGKSVLFIASYHPGFPTFFSQVKGLQRVFKPTTVRLDIEFMDAKRFYSDADQQIFFDSLQKKIQHLPRYDLVIVGDDAALHFVDKHRKTLFPDQPIVFFGINDVPYALSFDANSRVTGVIEQISVAETITLARKLFCAHSPMIVITDGTESGYANARQIETYMPPNHPDQYRLLSLADYSFGELNDTLRQLENPCAILVLSVYRDRTGTAREFDQSLREIRQSTAAPLFHFWYHGLGNGIFGGKLISHRKQAEAAARIALQILQGASPATLPVQRETRNTYVFDYNEIQRFGLNEADMPKGSRFINKPDPLFRRYRLYMFWLIAFASTLVLVVMVLMIRSHRREKAQQRMLALNRELEEKVIQRTEALEIAHHKTERMLRMRDSILDNSLVSIVLMKGRHIEWINHYAEEMFGYNHAEVVGSISKFVYLSPDDFDTLEREAPKILQRGKSYRGEYAFRRKDGSIWWGIISGKAIDPAHLEKGILFIIVDITARKQAEDQLKQLNLLLEKQATTDHLTGISNRRHITTLIGAEICRSNRYPEPFSVILLDIDYFKHINDTYGHDAGDHVLQSIATLLRQSCREVDTVARWGGEEFLVLCPETELMAAARLAELLRERIEQYSFSVTPRVTASFGVACHQKSQTLDVLLSAADTALYKAKEKRNNVCC